MARTLLEEFHRAGINTNLNPRDIIQLDVPLFIRLLEYAREDAQTDMQLHDVAERILNVCASGRIASMRHYKRIVR
jgi:hypothetical protein